jgi:hypothetical protein
MTSILIPERMHMMSEQQFDDQLKSIEERYSHGPASHDQELARLLAESGWTQEELARRMGKTQGWVCQQILFGRFLALYYRW